MDMLVLTGVLIVLAYVVPLFAERARWLLSVAAFVAMVCLALWVFWVGGQTDSLGRGVSALFVMFGAGSALAGVLVQSAILWRGWTGWRRAAAIICGAALVTAGIFAPFMMAA
jgi:hypothetical protein